MSKTSGGSTSAVAKYNEVPTNVASSDAFPGAPNLTFMGNDIQNGVTPESFKQYSQDLYDPANRTLTETYNTQLGRGANGAATNGTINSIGFQDYKQNVLDKNLATGRADLQSKANLDTIDTINSISNQNYQNQLSRADLIQGENQVRNNYSLGAYQAQESARANRVNEAQNAYNGRNWLMKIFS